MSKYINANKLLEEFIECFNLTDGEYIRMSKFGVETLFNEAEAEDVIPIDVVAKHITTMINCPADHELLSDEQLAERGMHCDLKDDDCTYERCIKDYVRSWKNE